MGSRIQRWAQEAEQDGHDGAGKDGNRHAALRGVGLGTGGIVGLAHVGLVHFQDLLREPFDLLEQGQEHGKVVRAPLRERAGRVGDLRDDLGILVEDLPEVM